MNIGKIQSAATYIKALVNAVSDNLNIEATLKHNAALLMKLLQYLDESLELIGGDVLNVLGHIEKGNFKITGADDCNGTTASGQRVWLVSITIPEVISLTLNYKASDFNGWEIDEAAITTKILADIDNIEIVTKEYSDAFGDLSVELAELVEGADICNTLEDYIPTSEEQSLLRMLDTWADVVNEPTGETFHLVDIDIFNGEDKTTETTLICGAKDDEDAGNQAILAISRNDYLHWNEKGAVVNIGYPAYQIKTVRPLTEFEAKTYEPHFNVQYSHCASSFINANHSDRLIMSIDLKGDSEEHNLNLDAVSIENPVLGNYLLDISSSLPVRSEEGVSVQCEFTSDEDEIKALFGKHIEGTNGLPYNSELNLIALLNHSKTELLFNPLPEDRDEESNALLERIIKVQVCDEQVEAEYVVKVDTSL